MRHRSMQAPINSRKHYVHSTNSATASGAIRAIVAVNAVVSPASGTAADVVEGAVVKAVHFEHWILSTGGTGTTNQFGLIVEKVPAGQTAVTAAQLNNLGSYPNKKNVFYSTQGVLSNFIDGQNAVPILRDWLLIPKGKQRMGLGDRVVMTLTPTGQALNNCGLITYKEYI